MPAYPALLDPSVDTYKVMRESVNSMITRLESIESSGVAAHTQDFSTITNTPTTLAGYGIVDGSTFDGAFSSLTGVPTTLSGYGITDAIQTGNIQGSSDFDTVDGGDIPISVIPTGELGTQVALGNHTHGPGDANTYNSIIGIDTNIGPLSGATVVSEIQMTDGVITATDTRTLTPGDIGAATAGHSHSFNPTIGTDTDVLANSGATVISTLTLTDGVITASSTRSLDALNTTSETTDTTCYLWFSTGNLGVNTVRTNTNIQVNASTSEISATSFNATSDLRLKENINQFSSRSASFINTVEFDYIGEGVLKKQVGYVAQDVQEHMPDAVHQRDDGMLTVNYNMVHSAKIARLEQELRDLKAQLGQ